MAYLKKNPEAQKPLQVTVQSQDQWEGLLQKEGLIVVDAYSAWCGPCKAVVSTLRRMKNEVGDSLLHFAIAETDNIDSLSLYRGKSQPTFLFFANGTLVYVIRGCNCPVIIKTIKNQLDKEHKVLEGKVERIEYFDKEVRVEQEEKKDEQKEFNEEDEETEVPKEVSLAIIKPDAVKAGLVDEIIAKVEADGLEILRKEERTLTKEEAAEFYKQHEGSEHFEDLVEFMSSGPCLTLIISNGETGQGVIPQFRDLIGPKDVNAAKEEAPSSIRALYGTSSMMNAIHACDTTESAARELAFFFPDFVSPAVKAKKLIKQSSQRTLALIRPDALRHHKDSIIAKIKEAGFSVAMAKELTLSREEAEDFYAEHKDKDFFEALVNNMCSGPVMALCLARDDAVEGWRNMLGPKEVDVAAQEAPESLRAQFKVEDSGFNPLHGSDSRTAADVEIQKIFPVQTTVAVIKPETAEESGDAIINKIKESGFRIISRKDVGLTKELAHQFYNEHTGKDFFNGLTDYMSSGQSTVLLLEREDAVSGWRAMMGPTDPEEAREKAPESIRAVFGKDIVRNAVHGSSDVTKAGKVIEELFPDVELMPSGRAVVKNTEVDVSHEESEDSKNLPANTGETEEQNSAEGAGEDGKVAKEDGQVAKEDGEVAKEDGQVAKEDGEVAKEDGQVAKEDGQVAKEDGQVAKEDGQVAKEDGQVAKEDGQVAKEDGQVAKEDGQVTSENEKINENEGLQGEQTTVPDTASGDVAVKDDGNAEQDGGNKDSTGDGQTKGEADGGEDDTGAGGNDNEPTVENNDGATVDSPSAAVTSDGATADGGNATTGDGNVDNSNATTGDGNVDNSNATTGDGNVDNSATTGDANSGETGDIKVGNSDNPSQVDGADGDMSKDSATTDGDKIASTTEDDKGDGDTVAGTKDTDGNSPSGADNTKRELFG